MDPNKRAKDKFAQAHARRQFQQAYATGTARLIDRFNQPIGEGDAILFTPANPLVFEVHDISPVLDPNAPVGLIKFNLVAVVPFNTAANQPVAQFIRLIQKQSGVVGVPVGVPEGTTAEELPAAPGDAEQPSPSNEPNHG